MSEELNEQKQISPGKMLKEAREALNLSTQDIADKVRLKNSLIQEIEADNYDFNISLTFLKGYLKLYAKQVGIQSELVINAFDNLETQKKEPARLQSFSKRIAHQAHDDKLMLVTYLIVGVVLALVVVWWFQQSSSSPTMTGLNNPAVQQKLVPASSVEDQPDTADANMADSADSSPTATYDADTGGEAVSSDEQSAETADVTASDNAQIFELAPSRQGIVQMEEPAVSQKVDLVFTFSNECWMKLTDATGEDIAYGTKAQGRVMPVSGTPPFAVILCAPEVVSITYDGQAVDLSGFRQGSTAKFNLPFTE